MLTSAPNWSSGIRMLSKGTNGDAISKIMKNDFITERHGTSFALIKRKRKHGVAGRSFVKMNFYGTPV